MFKKIWEEHMNYHKIKIMMQLTNYQHEIFHFQFLIYQLIYNKGHRIYVCTSG